MAPYNHQDGDLHSLIREIIQSNREVQVADHDLLIATNEAVKTMTKIQSDHEVRLRKLEVKLYMATGGLALIELAVGIIAIVKH